MLFFGKLHFLSFFVKQNLVKKNQSCPNHTVLTFFHKENKLYQPDSLPHFELVFFYDKPTDVYFLKSKNVTEDLFGSLSDLGLFVIRRNFFRVKAAVFVSLLPRLNSTMLVPDIHDYTCMLKLKSEYQKKVSKLFS